MEWTFIAQLVGMFFTALFTILGVLLAYHNYLMRQINKRLKKEIYYIDKRELEKKLDEIKDDSKEQTAEIKAMIEKLGDKMEADYKNIIDHFLNCNVRKG